MELRTKVSLPIPTFLGVVPRSEERALVALVSAQALTGPCVSMTRFVVWPSDVSSKPVRWPPNNGRACVLPSDAKVHVSAMRRVELNPKYRPVNLLGHGGLEEWVIHSHDKDPVRQVHNRKGA